MNRLKKYQRGNIVIGVGLPPTQMVDVAGDYVQSGLPSGGGGWTLDAEYTTANGDLAAIENAFNASGGRPRSATLAWSPDGTKLTLSSSTSDDTKVFACSTPFDPNTASQIFTAAVTNPSWGFYNRAGSRFVNNIVVGDEYVMNAASGFVITSVAELSDITKANVGFTSSTDGPAVFGPDFDYMLWLGGQPGDALKNISIPGGDLDAFVVEETYFDGALDPNGGNVSNLDATETILMRGKGSPGISFITMNSPREVSSWVEGAAQSVNGLVSFDFRPDSIWFDPLDTRYVWATDDPGTDLQLVRFATNVPTF